MKKNVSESTCHHLVIKASERTILDPVLELFNDCPTFAVQEYGSKGDKDQGEHWHVWIQSPLTEEQIRKKVDKVRPSKNKGFSYRAWDVNLQYFCKGQKKGTLPVVVRNTVDGITDEVIQEMHDEYWKNGGKVTMKEAAEKFNLKAALIEWAKVNTPVTMREISCSMVEMVLKFQGDKMLPMKHVGQQYIRTAFALQYDKKEFDDTIHGSTASYYMDGLDAGYEHNIFSQAYRDKVYKDSMELIDHFEKYSDAVNYEIIDE